MPAPLRRKTFLSRLLVAAFALWLPVATGQGGRATCNAAAMFAKSLSAGPVRPHLSCHGENGQSGAKAKKDCCCKNKTGLRSANCGCHDGKPGFGLAAHDPMLGTWLTRTPALADRHARRAAQTDATAGRLGDAPDPPPPRSIRSAYA